VAVAGTVVLIGEIDGTTGGVPRPHRGPAGAGRSVSAVSDSPAGHGDT